MFVENTSTASYKYSVKVHSRNGYYWLHIALPDPESIEKVC